MADGIDSGGLGEQHHARSTWFACVDGEDVVHQTSTVLMVWIGIAVVDCET